MPDPGEHLIRVVQFRGRGRQGGPRQAATAGDQRRTDRLLVHHEHIRRELVDQSLHIRDHRRGQWDEEVLPQELQRCRATQRPRPLADGSLIGAGQFARQRKQGESGWQERPDHTGVAGDGGVMTAFGKFTGDSGGRVDMPGQRRHDEQKATHGDVTGPASIAA